LLAPALGSLQAGSPIFYRGVEVGEVLECRLGEHARKVVIEAFVRTNYAALVRQNSVFWNAGGVNFHLGLFSGAQVSAESAQAILSGGIEFATPPEFSAAATNGAHFELHEKIDEAWKKWEPEIDLGQKPPPLETQGTNGQGLMNLRGQK
jgi:paraquat-inducible protein B